ncbi:NAD(P)H-dependent flavin oxidoreductase [Pseudomonas vanderleydeniana]|uniref:Nitronate monooxygenase n=1 Tax=Pseudomonas vanderleydeniana TaxID=2745495 RepID=A0A9E6TQJ7_9PSED|nr:nitronate monooxygenase [Pseudomonas vanderleydeniana]QXI26517.1 nitronate monooxygenase [Pseudomonas vanderleydeniana]
MSNALLSLLNVQLPIIQAPMAGVATPQLAAAVSNAGGLGSLGIGASNVDQARQMIRDTAALTSLPFNVNVFCHQPALPDPARDQAWLELLGPVFAEFGAEPPAVLREIYRSFLDDAPMLQMLLEEKPAVVSFHFGLPPQSTLAALKDIGAKLLCSVTSLAEARMAEQAGVDALVAQGYEAGGHRGIFDPREDTKMGTVALTRLLVSRCALPVIAAGGIMDGAGIRAALTLGASAAQLGTAFILCPESSANAAYRAALKGPAAERTEVTCAISGRPARGLVNRNFALREGRDVAIAAYPYAYDANKQLNAAATAKGCHDFAAQWAGQAAPLARELPAAALVALLAAELE